MVQGLVARPVRVRQGGFSYVIVMFLVAATSILALHILDNGATRERRIKEEELLYVGGLYLKAIGNYYELSPGTAKSFPPTLDALLEDDRTLPRRYLRRRFRDPMTNSDQWGLVLDQDGKVTGVYSLSKQAPVKQTGFPEGFGLFEKARAYSDWKFVYLPH